MPVLYLSTSPLISNLNTDATFQDILCLQERWGGEILSLVPFTRPMRSYPRILFGMHNRKKILNATRQSELVHVFGSGLYPIPILKKLSQIKPVLYTSLTDDLHLGVESYQHLKHIFCPTQEATSKVQSLGQVNSSQYYPYINPEHVANHPVRSQNEDKLRILFASAPWNATQFDLKCIPEIISACEVHEYLEVTMLWRGIEVQRIRNMIDSSTARDRVTLIDAQVNIREYISRSDAGILLCKDPRILKAYPHSLLELLMSGRPVLISRGIALSELVESTQSGIVLSNHSLKSITQAVTKIKAEYTVLQQNSELFPGELFGRDRFLETYGKVYRRYL